MKKIVCILGLSLFLTGCSSFFIEMENSKDGVDIDEIESIADTNNKATYVDEDIKELIVKINSLREKYKNSMNEEQYEYEAPYIDLQNPGMKGLVFDNYSFNDKDYFKDLIQILDESLAKGLEDHIGDMKVVEIKASEIILRKIGRTVVYAENRGEDSENYISIRVDFSDIRDEDYKALLDQISDDKYILDNIVIGDKLNMIDFVNLDNFYRVYDSREGYLSIRYNVFLEEKDIKKVNILLSARKGTDIEDEDMDVFTNLLNTLEIEGEDRRLLLEEYKDVFKSKSNNREIALEDYKLLIEANKGSGPSTSDEKLVYFSIERI